MTEGERVRRARKAGGAGARRQKRSSGGNPSASLKHIKMSVPRYEPLSEEQLLHIEAAADQLLEEIGIDFREDEEFLQLWAEAGAHIDGERIRFPKGLCRDILKTAPRQFTQHARNPERSVEIGGDNMVFAPVYGPPFVSDLEKGRRYATLEDFQNFVKLAYIAPSMHHSGGTVCEPVDVPVNKRHLDMVYSHIKYSDKPFMGSVTAPERAQDTVDMAKIVFGDAFVDQNCVLISLINANSPMVFDGTMLGALKVYAANNQACITAPFILAGAMSPVTVGGTMTQILAEILAGAASTQLIRKGAPVVAGTFASATSMQTGAPTFGTPEPALVSYGVSQLVKRIGIPFRSGGGLCGSKAVDAQAAYESANTLNMTMMAGVNFVLHAAGWLEGGLVSSYEKFIMDCDQLGMIQAFSKGYDLSPSGMAYDALKEVGPGNHFLGCEHTQKNFEHAFYRSFTADNTTFEQWTADGNLTADQRAHKTWKNWLASYQPPELDADIDARLQAFIQARKASEPDSFSS